MLEVFPLNQIADVGAPKSKDPMLFSREIIFQEFQVPTYVITVPKRYGQTDGQTDNIRSQYRALH